MSALATYILHPLPHPSRGNAKTAIDVMPQGTVVEFKQPTRTLEQNRLLWPILTLWSRHQRANVNGKPKVVTKEAWKIIHLADWRNECGATGEMALTPNGAIVPLGFSTKSMGKHEFCEFLTWLLAETANTGMMLPVRVSDECEAYLKANQRRRG